MSFTACSRALVAVSICAVAMSGLAAESPSVFSCASERVERVALRQAPGKAQRVNKHVLEVVSQKGVRRFIDKPPYDEGERAGVRWRYCGYDARVKAHLIELLDESVYSGYLLWDETGKRMRAGHTVLFAPTGTAFLAIEQEDGVDGENWTVHDATGKAIWKGYAGTVAKIAGIDNVISTFDRPRWTRQGALTARFVCASSKMTGVVTLMRAASGDWHWRGHGKCV